MAVHQLAAAAASSVAGVSLCAEMLHDRGGLINAYVPPKSRPLLEQVELAQRIAIARSGPASLTWDQIADVERIPKRTAQHFFKAWMDGLKAPTTRRSADALKRYLRASQIGE